MSRMIRGAAVLVAAVLAVSACGGGDDPLAGDGGGSAITIGGADFPESGLLGEIYAQALEAKDVKVTRKFGIGSREVYYNQVKSGAIQVFPEYNGALLAHIDQENPASTTQEVDAALRQKLPPELEVLTPSQAENKDSLVVTKATADKYKLTKIDDLRSVAGELIVGGPPEFKTRQQGLVGLEKVYGLKFKQFKSLDTAGPITVSNLQKDQVQAADLFSTDPAIQKNGFVALQDTKNVFGAQNVLPLVYKSKVNDTVRATLNAVSAKLTTAGLLEMNTEMSEKKTDPETVAKDWLTKNGIISG
ncbi:ABC transporter substrate-binding protein [Actinomadura sp. SCN-SB]|uniref:ABC transporter substrate-binding protein n=1 Tax=Actinomadura sp. SCN-SB TaxID=3373092 RepID=UPI0037506E0A